MGACPSSLFWKGARKNWRSFFVKWDEDQVIRQWHTRTTRPKNQTARRTDQTDRGGSPNNLPGSTVSHLRFIKLIYHLRSRIRVSQYYAIPQDPEISHKCSRIFHKYVRCFKSWITWYLINIIVGSDPLISSEYTYFPVKSHRSISCFKSSNILF